MTRAMMQGMIAVMLGFGAVTLILRGVVYLRLGYPKRGIMYFGFSLIAGFFAAVSFYFALWEVRSL